MKFYYVYVLQSLKTEWIYVGSTSDLRQRFKSHNNGKKILLINQKWESDNDKVKPDIVFIQYAFILDLENDHVSKINFSGTDVPVKFSRVFLEDSDEIVDLKWLN